MQQSAKRRVLVYIGLLIAFTLAANFVATRLGDSPVASLVIMWSPGLAAIVASIATRRSFKKIGWKPWPVKWLGVGWLGLGRLERHGLGRQPPRLLDHHASQGSVVGEHLVDLILVEQPLAEHAAEIVVAGGPGELVGELVHHAAPRRGGPHPADAVAAGETSQQRGRTNRASSPDSPSALNRDSDLSLV